MSTTWKDIVDAFDSRLARQPLLWGILLLSIGVLCLAIYVLRRLLSPEARAARVKKALFRKLAAANGLGSEERAMLKRIADYYRLEDPAQIFLKRSLFEGAQSSLSIDSSLADALRKKLYR